MENSSRDKSSLRLVWSDDPKDKTRVEGKSAIKQPKTEIVLPGSWCAVFRLEKNGRGGKTVTVIDRLPGHDTFLKDLCKELKSKCGSGGTFAVEKGSGTIEIQGDKREAIKAIFQQKGFKFKGM
jgi:translation initiation factor 1